MKKHITIILIDDSSSSNLYHKVMMEDAGIDIESSVKEFISSIEAKAYFQKLIDENQFDLFPDVILLDINMPIFNGWEFVTYLESLKLGVNLPRVFMVSNSRSPRDLEKAESYTIVEDILEKHVTQEFFEKLVKEL